MRKVRLTFRCEVVISGDDLKQISDRWEDLPLFSEEAREYDADYVEMVSAEDAETNEDISTEWRNIE